MTSRKWTRMWPVVAMLAMVVATSAFVTVVAQPKYGSTLLGTYWGTSQRFDSAKSGGQAGCSTETWLAGDSEFVGNIAYISAYNTIKTDTILTNYNAVAGVVVGGQRTGMQNYADSTSVGTLAATSGQKVTICTRGRVWVTHDTTASTLPGIVIIPSNRSAQRGRFGSRTTAIDSLYRAIGKALDTGLTGRRTLIRLNVK